MVAVMAAASRPQMPVVAASDRVHLLIGFHVTDDPCSHVGFKSGSGDGIHGRLQGGRAGSWRVAGVMYDSG